MEKTELYSILEKIIPVSVEFKKVDGTLRKMKCTRNLQLIPEEKHPKSTESKETSSIRVFDLEKSEWRSFRFENLIGIIE